MAVLPVVALFAVILLIGALGGWSSPSGSPLRGVSAEDFAQLRIEPAEAGTVPAIGEAAAIGISNGRPEPGEVRQALLARDLSDGGRLVWVLNFEPDSVVPRPPSGGGFLSTDPKDITVKFALAFVDATTGEWLHSLQEATSVPVEN